jgi:hypothetical protein
MIKNFRSTETGKLDGLHTRSSQDKEIDMIPIDMVNHYHNSHQQLGFCWDYFRKFVLNVRSRKSSSGLRLRITFK